MNPEKHCEICDLQVFSIQEGRLCSLTNQKPDFTRTCVNIALDKRMKERIIKINTEYNDSKYVGKLAWANLAFYGVIGIGVLALCYYISIKFLELGYFHTGTIVIFAIGLTVIGSGIGAMNFSSSKKAIANPKKEQLDAVLDLYHKRYDFESEISTDMMGVKETKIKLRIDGETIEKTSRY